MPSSCAPPIAPSFPLSQIPPRPPSPPRKSIWTILWGGIIYTYGELNNQGEIRPAQVAVATNGSLGKIATPGNYENLFSLNVLGEGKVTGTGYYYKHNLKDATVELRRNAQVLDSVVYDGEAQWFDIVAMVGDRAYDSSSDFTVDYLDPSGNAIKPEQIVNAGTYKVQVKGKTAKVRSAKVAKKAQTIKRAKAYKVTKAKGKRTYKLASVSKKKFKKYFAVNKKTGNITVKKGLKKGTYTLKIKVRAAGTANYKARTKTVKCKVNVA